VLTPPLLVCTAFLIGVVAFCVMRWAHPAGVTIRMSLTIFRMTARFLIPRATKHLCSQMMRTHPESIDSPIPC